MNASSITLILGDKAVNLTWNELTTAFRQECQTSEQCLQVLSVANNSREYVTSEALDIIWLFFCTLQIFLMQSGFAFLACTNSFDTSIHFGTRSIAICGLVLFLFYIVVFPMIYVGGDEFLGHGGGGFALSGTYFEDDTNIYHGTKYAFWLMQACIIMVPTGVIFASLERRVAFPSLITYISFIVVIAYPLVGHAVWSVKGWASLSNSSKNDILFGVGVIDFAGCSVIHITAGVSVLLATIVLRPRKGRFAANGDVNFQQENVLGHSIGTLLLWVGWYGLANSSTVTLSKISTNVSTRSCVNLTLSGAFSGFFSLIWGVALHITQYRSLTTVVNNGLLSGLVAVSSCSSVIEPVSAIVIGFVASVVYIFSSKLILWFKLDDTIDAIAIHLSNGIWGLIAAGLFSISHYIEEGNKTSSRYLFVNNDTQVFHPSCGLIEWCDGIGLKQFGANCCFALLVVLWVGCVCTIFCSFFHYMEWLQGMDENLEQEELDDLYSIQSELWEESEDEAYKV